MTISDNHYDISNSSHIVIDLGSKSTGPALATLTQMPRKCRKVKSASIVRHSGTCIRYEVRSGLDSYDLLNIFRALASLPHLASVMIDLEDLVLPMDSLVVLLQATPNLNHLRLQNVMLSGNLTDQNALKSALSEHTKLHSLHLNCCRGIAAVHILLTKPRSLSRIRIRSTQLSQRGFWPGISLIQICRYYPELDILELHDIPDLDDKSIQLLVNALGSEGLKLRKLHISSQEAGQMAGESILKLVRNSPSITDLGLNLGGVWRTCGNSVADHLISNTNLTKITLNIIPGNANLNSPDIANTVFQIANALQCPSTRLTHLTLLFHLKKLTKSGLYQKIIAGMDSLLEVNNILQGLKIADVHEPRNRLVLPPDLQWKLDLNRSGIPELLCQNNGLPPMEPYLQAMASSSDDLNVSFFGLMNNPMLFCCGTKEQMETVKLFQRNDKYHYKRHAAFVAGRFFKKSYNSVAWRRRVLKVLGQTRDKASFTARQA